MLNCEVQGYSMCWRGPAGEPIRWIITWIQG